MESAECALAGRRNGFIAVVQSDRPLRQNETTKNENDAGIELLSGGARRSRTADLLNAIQALSQLSYGPFRDRESVIGNQV
jgi:hypothetical protein